MISKVLGLWRELEMARFFGVSMATDAFMAASTLLFFVARMASDSLLVNTPALLAQYSHQQVSIPWGDLLRALLLVAVVLTLLAGLLLPSLVPALFVGLSQDTQHLTSQLVYRMLPLVAGWALIGALGGILNVQHRYGRYQAALMIANVGILVTLGLLARHIGIEALAWGWVFGIGAGVLVVVAPLWDQTRGLGTWHGWSAQWSALRSLLAGTGGLSLWFLLNQVPVWIERYYAAQLPSGSLSALGYAQRLFQLPLEMVTTVVMSVWVARVASMPVQRVSRQTFRLMGALASVTFPLALVLAFLARPMITLVYARGAFDAQAVISTTGPFAMYAMGLGFHALSAVLVRTFQARGLVRYPLYAVIVDILLTMLLNRYAFQKNWGVMGIAGINSCVAAIRAVSLAILAGFPSIFTRLLVEKS